MLNDPSGLDPGIGEVLMALWDIFQNSDMDSMTLTGEQFMDFYDDIANVADWGGSGYFEYDNGNLNLYTSGGFAYSKGPAGNRVTEGGGWINITSVKSMADNPRVMDYNPPKSEQINTPTNFEWSMRNARVGFGNLWTSLTHQKEVKNWGLTLSADGALGDDSNLARAEKTTAVDYGDWDLFGFLMGRRNRGGLRPDMAHITNVAVEATNALTYSSPSGQTKKALDPFDENNTVLKWEPSKFRQDWYYLPSVFGKTENGKNNITYWVLDRSNIVTDSNGYNYYDTKQVFQGVLNKDGSIKSGYYIK